MITLYKLLNKKNHVYGILLLSFFFYTCHQQREASPKIIHTSSGEGKIQTVEVVQPIQYVSG